MSHDNRKYILGFSSARSTVITGGKEGTYIQVYPQSCRPSLDLLVSLSIGFLAFDLGSFVDARYSPLGLSKISLSISLEMQITSGSSVPGLVHIYPLSSPLAELVRTMWDTHPQNIIHQCPSSRSELYKPDFLS